MVDPLQGSKCVWFLRLEIRSIWRNTVVVEREQDAGERDINLQKRKDQEKHVERALLIPAHQHKDQLHYDVDQQQHINSQQGNL